jgi:hypothetical protein
MNRVLRGWAQFFRYGNSARHFDVIRNYALMRLTLVIAKRHQRTRAYGRSVLFFQSPDHLGLVKLDGTVVAPDPSGTGGERRMPAVNDVGEPCAGEPHAWFEAAGAGNGATWPRPPEWDSLAGTAGTPKAPGPPPDPRHRASSRPDTAVPAVSRCQCLGLRLRGLWSRRAAAWPSVASGGRRLRRAQPGRSLRIRGAPEALASVS